VPPSRGRHSSRAFLEAEIRGERLHPRFLLTELGGLYYDYGLDEGQAHGEKTIVTLMDHALFLQTLADFSSTGPSFDITPDCIIDVRGEG
jgi:hypothetical protein